MALITPTRFGLKFAPVPTLAIEYEEPLGVLEDDDGARSLYVHKDRRDMTSTTSRVCKKLHVVELPQLSGDSEPQALARQLQSDNHRFLGPRVVKEQQLQRLLQRLVDHLARDTTATKTTSTGTPAPSGMEEDEEGGEEEEEGGEEDRVEESAMNESAVGEEASMSMDQAGGEASPPRPSGFITHHESDHAAGDDAEHDEPSGKAHDALPALTDTEQREADDDEKKKQTLKSESDASDDVQSEELEYFSEDGSDEDSF